MDGHATVGEVVEVWAGNSIRQAQWDGLNWIDELSHQVLVGVMYWRPVKV